MNTLYPPMVGTGSVLAWSGFGKEIKSGKADKSEWPRFVLHSKPNLRESKPFRERKGWTTLIRPE